MGAFNDKVYEMVAQIPEGCVSSYGDIARAVGEPRKARFVGYAMHASPGPDVLPCHRVVFKDGSLCEGYVFGGADVQRKMLEDEGVRFCADGRVDMEACRWTSGTLDCYGRPADIDWAREME